MNRLDQSLAVPGGPERIAYEVALVTQRSAELLARHYGFDNLAALAEDLPPGAKIIDVAAGASSLGREVALLRSDVGWINFDVSYDDPRVRDELTRDAPANLAFVAGDATQLDQLFPPNYFDEVFSFWLFPHLSLKDTDRAEAAAKALFAVTKIGGNISVGPVFNPPAAPEGQEIPFGDAGHVTKVEDASPDEFAHETVCQTRLPLAVRYIYRAINRARYEQFGTGRTRRGQGLQGEIFDPQTGGYVPRYSGRGVQLASQFAIAVAARLVMQGHEDS